MFKDGPSLPYWVKTLVSLTNVTSRNFIFKGNQVIVLYLIILIWSSDEVQNSWPALSQSLRQPFKPLSCLWTDPSLCFWWFVKHHNRTCQGLTSEILRFWAQESVFLQSSIQVTSLLMKLLWISYSLTHPLGSTPTSSKQSSKIHQIKYMALSLALSQHNVRTLWLSIIYMPTTPSCTPHLNP